ncbi:MAG TPA: SDR family oxidoreductase [Pyrinomonadaceae bacterium]|nr:SDR family oxidoreductase [Pyrinomonadaceae bacterium]
MKKVLVAGATGRLGAEVLCELSRRGYRTRALVRDRARLKEGAARGVEVFEADARSPGSLEGACEGCHVVVSAMGASLALGRTRERASGFREVDFLANVNLLERARREGVGKFVYVSLHGAERLRGLGYVDAHEEFVGALAASGMQHTIVRPTGFFHVFAEIFRMAERGRVVIVGGGEARTNPVDERDVARECADAVEVGERELPVGGPETYTRREIAELAFEALGRPPNVTSVPAALVRALIKPVRLFDRRLYDLLEFGAAVSTRDLVAPPAGEHGLRQFFRRLAGQAPAAARAPNVTAGDMRITSGELRRLSNGAERTGPRP